MPDPIAYVRAVDERARVLYFALIADEGAESENSDLAREIAQDQAEGEALAAFIASQPRSNGGTDA